MTCTEFNDRLSAYMDGELTGWRRWKVALHLRECAECGTLLRELEEVDRSLMAVVEETPAPEYITPAVMHRIPAMPPASRRVGMLRWAVGIAVALVQILGMYGAYWRGFAQGRDVSFPFASAPSMERPMLPVVESAPPVNRPSLVADDLSAPPFPAGGLWSSPRNRYDFSIMEPGMNAPASRNNRKKTLRPLVVSPHRHTIPVSVGAP
jgi:hypothetical protein